jgi:hypothetical protein
LRSLSIASNGITAVAIQPLLQAMALSPLIRLALSGNQSVTERVVEPLRERLGRRLTV